jgi:uncharacterized protein (DUF952 family)
MAGSATALPVATVSPVSRARADAQAGDGGVGRAVAVAVGQEEEAALGAGDAHDGVQHLLQDLAQDERRVQRLYQRQQELLLLDPGELRDLLGGAVGRDRRELQGHVAELDLRAGTQVAPLDAGGVDVHAVQAPLVLDRERAVVVQDAGVALRDRGLGQAEVVVAGAADGVRARLEEVDLLGEAAAHDLEHCDGEVSLAVPAAMGVGGILPCALRAQHGRKMITHGTPVRQS